ncbi:MAG: transporter [Candidatus Poribacteria bacterium]|nr:MAG: transporter [Candidatus Poribacteria bacterium]
MTAEQLVLLIFSVTYLGIALGGVPGLALDRTGIALLGAIALVAGGLVSTPAAIASVDASTILLLYGLMVLSAQFRVGGFYTRLARGIVSRLRSPEEFLLWLMAASAGLSALLANDIVCLAFAPVVTVSAARAGLNPIPFLLALAMSSNIGSAATIIGNPQNMLIGQAGALNFGRFLTWCAPPSLISLAIAYGLLRTAYRGRWHQTGIRIDESAYTLPPYNRWQSGKALFLTGVLVFLFLFTRVPREAAAIAVAGILLCSRRITTRTLLDLVDWHLITLFVSLFIVTGSLSLYGLQDRAMEALHRRGVDLNDPIVLAPTTLVLSNLFSNVPAVFLLLKNLDLSHPETLYLLALVSTYAGNLIPVGSIANLITIEQAGRLGVRIGFREYARLGVPVCLATVAIAVLWHGLVRLL